MSDSFNPPHTLGPLTPDFIIPEFISSRASSSSDTSSSSEPPVDPSLPKGFKWMGGRGFKENGNPAYMLPGDEPELIRLTDQHFQIRYIFQGNFQAPIAADLERGISVLDAGCGSGAWTIEMATSYPNSHFTGTDIVNVYEVMAPRAPGNCTFQLADTLKGLPFPDAHFDFVFQRFHELCFRAKEWPAVLKELVRVTKPGGWIELVESSLKPKDAGPCFSQIFDQIDFVLKMRNVSLDFPLTMDESLRSLGLKHTKQDCRSSPIGWGPLDLGSISLQNLDSFLNALKPQMLIVLGIAEEEYDATVTGVLDEAHEYNAFIDIQFAYGQKPLAG